MPPTRAIYDGVELHATQVQSRSCRLDLDTLSCQCASRR
jgi:hypothetical protein